MKHYDIIIIGSGLGGLECAVLQSRAGRSVLVLERSNQPGGCMQSYRRGGKMYDTGLHYVGGLLPGQALHDEFETLGLLDLPWERMDERFDRVMIGDREYSFAQGHEQFVECLAKEFPEDHEALKQYTQLLQNTPPETMDISAYEYLRGLFRSPLLPEILAGTSVKMELQRDTLPLFSLAHGVNSYIQSAWRLKGDGSLIVDRLVEQIKANGGELLCDAEVTELIEKDGQIAEAVCADGEHYAADQFVADIHPLSLCNMIKESTRIKKVYRRRLESLENTTGMFTVSLSLRPGTVPYCNWNEYIYTDDVWSGRGLGVMVSSRVPEDGTQYTSQIDLLSRMSWNECRAWENTKVGRRGEEYKEMKERKAAECIALAERILPNLSKCIEAKYISTPLTYRDYLGAPEGTAFGVRNDYHRSMMTYMSVLTPEPNLWLTGQNVVLPGVEGVTKCAFGGFPALQGGVL